MDSASFVCPVCAQVHPELPHLSSDFPEAYFAVPEAELAERVLWTPDTCVIDFEQYFVRGILELPVDDYPAPLGFNCWVALRREHHAAYAQAFTSPTIGPFRGWLATELACYAESTLLLKAIVHFRGGGLRPRIELEYAEHPLVADQRSGITLSMACQLVHYFD